MKQIIIKESVLRRALLETAIAGGSSPRESSRTALSTDLPLVPSEQVSVQLTVDRPAVEDPEFMPANPVELGRACQVLASAIPREKVSDFYRDFIRIVNVALDGSSGQRSDG